jgi:hypothetical protein
MCVSVAAACLVRACRGGVGIYQTPPRFWQRGAMPIGAATPRRQCDLYVSK